MNPAKRKKIARLAAVKAVQTATVTEAAPVLKAEEKVVEPVVEVVAESAAVEAVPEAVVEVAVEAPAPVPSKKKKNV